MDFTGALALSQTTIPLWAALPMILDFMPKISLTEIRSYYNLLGGYLILLFAIGLTNLFNNSGNIADYFVFFALLILNIMIAHRVSGWIMQEMMNRNTKWDKEFNKLEENQENSITVTLDEKRADKKPKPKTKKAEPNRRLSGKLFSKPNPKKSPKSRN